MNVDQMIRARLVLLLRRLGPGQRPAVFGEQRHSASDDPGDVVAVLVEGDVRGVDQLEPIRGEPDCDGGARSSPGRSSVARMPWRYFHDPSNPSAATWSATAKATPFEQLRVRSFGIDAAVGD